MAGSMVGIAILLGCGYSQVNSAKLQLSIRTTECAVGTYHHIPDTECRSFRRCLNGHWTTAIFSCPSGLGFNDKTHRCDWPHTFVCTDSDSIQQNQTVQTTASAANMPTSTAFALSSTTIQPDHCNPTTTVQAIISGATVTNNDTTSCPSGSSATPEAFVLAHCKLPLTSKWTRGLNVMQQCHSIPLYMPVATFYHDLYASAGGLTGVFLGCLPDGFKLGVQQCDQPPTILRLVNGGQFTMDPSVYFTVQ